MTTTDKALAKELALVTAILIREADLNGSVFQTFDKAYEIAEAFVDYFGVTDKWGDDLPEFDESVIKFANDYLTKTWKYCITMTEDDAEAWHEKDGIADFVVNTTNPCGWFIHKYSSDSELAQACLGEAEMDFITEDEFNELKAAQEDMLV